MNINSAGFLLFLFAAVFCYYLTPKRFRYLVLLAFSLIFYLTYSLKAIVYLGATMGLTYGFSLYLGALNEKKPADPSVDRRLFKKQLRRKKRRVLTAAMILNFLALGIFKYSGFVIETLSRLLGCSGNLPLPSFLLPLGISFYIFQTSGYLIDLYRGKYAPQRNFAKYALFVCYFPQMIQGPINRYDAMAPQLFDGIDFDWDHLQRGSLRMMLGILKKALIADPLSPVVQAIYTGYDAYPGLISFLGAALYCVQLYCDFSGGIDLVMGASQLFGVQMQENFRQPYFSTSLADFWRRWHISLGEWMKDDLFYPLALSKGFGRLTKKAKKVFPTELAKRLTPCLSTFLVFLAVGVWQGPGWSNIAYGLWNGFWMSLGLLWAPLGNRLFEKYGWNRKGFWLTLWGVLRTNLLVIVGRYFSGSSSLRGALGMLRKTASDPGLSTISRATFSSLGLSTQTVCIVAAALLALFFISLAAERGRDIYQWFFDRKWYVQFLILFVCLFVIVLGVYGNDDYTPIAYVYESV